MEDPYNQTSAYITPIYTYKPTHTPNGTLQSTHLEDIDFITDCLCFSVMLLGLCFVVFGLCVLVKTRHFSQVFVINLFISDLIQTSVSLIRISTKFLISQDLTTIIRYCMHYTYLIYIIGVMVNICFMVFISAERYAMIAHPVWYRNSHTIKTSAYVSVTVWILLPIIVLIIGVYTSHYIALFELMVFFLPYPSVMFFFVGTRRALSSNTTVPHHEQRRIMGTLALVLSIYTVLFLPYGVTDIDIYYPFIQNSSSGIYLKAFASVLMALNPLFDCVLYLFIRRDAKDILSALFFCFCERNEDNRETVKEAQRV